MPEETLRENKMGTMPENKLLLSMAVPMMISMLVQALYNIVDSIFVSRICEDALTAVSMAFPWQNIVISIAVGFGVGINALLSRALGQKNAERVNQVAVNGLLLAGLSYLLVLVAGLIGIRAYMRTQTDIETIVNYGITYLNICILCSFGVFVEITFERFLQATGRTVYLLQQITGAIFIYHERYILSYAEFPCFPFAVYQRAPKFSISAHFFKHIHYKIPIKPYMHTD